MNCSIDTVYKHLYKLNAEYFYKLENTESPNMWKFEVNSDKFNADKICV
jgi:hypothetical protein